MTILLVALVFIIVNCQYSNAKLPTSSSSSHNLLPSHEIENVSKRSRIYSAISSSSSASRNSNTKSILIAHGKSITSGKSYYDTLLSNWFYVAEAIVLITARINPHLCKTGGIFCPPTNLLNA
jgi:hypothetical protein